METVRFFTVIQHRFVRDYVRRLRHTMRVIMYLHGLSGRMWALTTYLRRVFSTDCTTDLA